MSARQLRRTLLLILLTLLAVGAVAVYSASAVVCRFSYGDSLHFLKTHLAGIGIGLAAAYGCLMIPFDRIRAASGWLVAGSLVLLVLVLVIGQQVGGAQRWFRLFGFSVQPSELAQLSLVVYLADLLERKADVIDRFREGLLPPLAVTGMTAVLVLLQPDLGTALVMVCTLMLLLIVAKADWRQLLGMVLLGAIGLAVLIGSAEYRRRRMLAFLDPWQDPQGVGYQIIQSFCALADGGLFGSGTGGSLQKLFFLPSAHTDFIFAIVGEELGWLGSTGVLFLFGLFVTCGFRLAMAADSLFSKYLVCGLTAMIGLEALINLGVVAGALPTKGLPLPFISYGGTSMIMNLVACALLFQASRNGERSYPHVVGE